MAAIISGFTVGQEVVSVGFWDFFRFFSWLLRFSQVFRLDFGMNALNYPKIVAAYSEDPTPSLSDLIDFDLAS